MNKDYPYWYRHVQECFVLVPAFAGTSGSLKPLKNGTPGGSGRLSPSACRDDTRQFGVNQLRIGVADRRQPRRRGKDIGAFHADRLANADRRANDPLSTGRFDMTCLARVGRNSEHIGGRL